MTEKRGEIEPTGAVDRRGFLTTTAVVGGGMVLGVLAAARPRGGDGHGPAVVPRRPGVDVAFDEGFGLVNPLTVRKQVEGQIAWGYDDTMYQEVTIQDGRAVEVNVDTYPISGMSEYPEQVNIAFFKTNKWIYGIGEEAIPPVAPAICNGVFQITGKRIRSLPLKNHDLSWG